MLGDRKLVVAGLWQTGYYFDWTCDRDKRGWEGQAFSSRDLLLALGGLLAIGALEKLLTKRVQQLDKTLLMHTFVYTFSIPSQYTVKLHYAFVHL